MNRLFFAIAFGFVVASYATIVLFQQSERRDVVQKEITCTSFDSHQQAQDFYEQHVEHWWTLDPKMTGLACPQLLSQRNGL